MRSLVSKHEEINMKAVLLTVAAALFVLLFVHVAPAHADTVNSEAIAHGADNANGNLKGVREALAAALIAQDADAINRAVAQQQRLFAEKRGVPEVADQYQSTSAQARVLMSVEATQAIARMSRGISQKRWWRIGLDPATLDRPLREPASAIIGLLALARADRANASMYLNQAREAGDFLRWAQSQAGAGLFPFPALQKSSTKAAFRAVPRALQQAAKRGESITRNGWLIEDGNDGGLQFDNGECGVAMFALYEATKDERYLDAARQSADWAMQRPLVTNWNYNSFSVYLLANAYRVTGNKAYLDSSIKKTLLGVIPGQLTGGQYAGRWADAHNARPTYHYIMLRSLVALAAVMPSTDAALATERTRIIQSLRLGLVARNTDFVDARKGAPTKETAMHVLLATIRQFSQDEEFLHNTQSREALNALSRLVSTQYRRGIEPMAPAEWGLFLEYVLKNVR
jgi:hypothetical protein